MKQEDNLSKDDRAFIEGMKDLNRLNDDSSSSGKQQKLEPKKNTPSEKDKGLESSL